MRKNFLLLVVPLLAICACSKHDPDPYDPPPPPAPPPPSAGVVRLNVTPLWNGALFDKNIIYTNVTDHDVRVQLFRLYLGDLYLLNDTSEHHLSDAELFNLTDGAQSIDLEAPAGTYTGLHFGIGIPESINHQDPTQYAADHPLSVSNGMHWDWANGYRFVIFDGRFDTLTNDTIALPELFSIHTGMDTCYREIALDGLVITVDSGAFTQVDITFDLAKFFYTATDTINLATDNQAHGGNIVLAARLSDCIQASVSVP